MAHSQRLRELDGIRGLAALAVVAFHYLQVYGKEYTHTFSSPEIAHYGFYGVHMFFLVSGFVIFWTISRTTSTQFLWSRFSRLYPVFWASVTLTFITVSLVGLPPFEVSPADYAANLTMFHQYLGFRHVDTVYWTLSLELAFYFWMYVALRLNLVEQVERWLMGLVVLSTALSTSKLHFQLPDVLAYRFETLLLMDYAGLFAAGVCFFKIWNQSASRFTYSLLALCIAALFLHHTPAMALLVCALHVVFFLAVKRKLTLLGAKPLVFLGTISYSLYLTHQNLGFALINAIEEATGSSLVGVLVTVPCAILLASCLTFFVEKPAMSALRKVYQKEPFARAA